MNGRNYALCQGTCGKVFRYHRWTTSDLRHCNMEARALTDQEARERIEGRPYKKRRKVVGAVASKGAKAERKRARDRFIQVWTNPYPPRKET